MKKIMLASLVLLCTAGLYGCVQPNLEDYPNSGEPAVDAIRITLAPENSAYGAQGKHITQQDEIDALLMVFASMTLNENIALDVDVDAPSSSYELFCGEDMVESYVFLGNDSTTFWTGESYELVDYEDLTPYQLYQQSEADIVISYLEDNFSQAVDISKKHVEHNEESKFIDYLQPKIEVVTFQESHLIFNTACEETIDLLGKTAYVIRYATEYDELIGPIVFYVEADSFSPLGFGARK